MGQRPYQTVDGYRRGDRLEWNAASEVWVAAVVQRVYRRGDIKYVEIRVTENREGTAYIGEVHNLDDGSDLRRSGEV